jgi:hypothetical protein
MQELLNQRYDLTDHDIHSSTHAHNTMLQQTCSKLAARMLEIVWLPYVVVLTCRKAAHVCHTMMLGKHNCH